jgi:hypothetical protein
LIPSFVKAQSCWDFERIPAMWFPPGEVFGGAAFLSKPVDYLVSTEAVTHATTLEPRDNPVFQCSIRAIARDGLLIAYDYFVLYKSLHISPYYRGSGGAAETAKRKNHVCIFGVYLGVSNVYRYATG